jgi:hypothetical protein
MKIAILDVYNHDIGLKLLFPESDYFIIFNDKSKEINQKNNNIIPSYELSRLVELNLYDYIFIIIPLYDLISDTKFYKGESARQIISSVNYIIRNRSAKKYVYLITTTMIMIQLN